MGGFLEDLGYDHVESCQSTHGETAGNAAQEADEEKQSVLSDLIYVQLQCYAQQANQVTQHFAQDG